MEVEVICAVLYTGPQFIKYNGVLKGMQVSLPMYPFPFTFHQLTSPSMTFSHHSAC